MKILKNKNLKEKKIMKNCKKIISSVLTLTLFAGSVVNLSCFAGHKYKNQTTQGSVQESAEEVNRRHSYAEELDRIKNSVKEYSGPDEFNYAFGSLNNLKNQLSEVDRLALSENIKSTESYLIDMQQKALQFMNGLYDKKRKENKALNTKLKEKCNDNKKLSEKLSIKNFLLGLVTVGFGFAAIYFFGTKADLSHKADYYEKLYDNCFKTRSTMVDNLMNLLWKNNIFDWAYDKLEIPDYYKYEFSF